MAMLGTARGIGGRSIFAAALIVGACGAASAAARNECPKADIPIECKEGPAQNGAYCLFPDGGAVRQACPSEAAWDEDEKDTGEKVSAKERFCLHYCVATHRPVTFAKVYKKDKNGY